MSKLFPALLGAVSFGSALIGALLSVRLREADGSSFMELYEDNCPYYVPVDDDDYPWYTHLRRHCMSYIRAVMI